MFYESFKKTSTRLLSMDMVYYGFFELVEGLVFRQATTDQLRGKNLFAKSKFSIENLSPENV